MTQTTPKVFAISLPRTGTRTLREALTILGYRALHNPYPAWQQLVYDHAPPFQDIDFDAMTHCAFWHIDELAAAYPGARFIYFDRQRPEWLRSIETKIGEPNGRRRPGLFIARMATFGQVTFSREHHRNVFNRHRLYVEAAFSRVPGLWLTRYAWEPICQFLEQPVPDVPFPHIKDEPK